MNEISLGRQSKKFQASLRDIYLVKSTLTSAISIMILCFLNISSLMAVKDSSPYGPNFGDDSFSVFEHQSPKILQKKVTHSQPTKIVIDSKPIEPSIDFSPTKLRKSLSTAPLKERASYIAPVAKLLVHEDLKLRRKIPALLTFLLEGQPQEVWKNFFHEVYPLLGHPDEVRRDSVHIFICRIFNNEIAETWIPLFGEVLNSPNDHIRNYSLRLKHRFWAISGKDGKRLLNAIKQEVPPSEMSFFLKNLKLPWNVKIKSFLNLKSRYQKEKSRLKEIGTQEEDISRLVYSNLLKMKYPLFDWPEDIDLDKLPQLYGQPLSIGSYLLLDLHDDLYRYEDELLLETLLQKLQVMTPDRRTMVQLGNWLKRGKEKHHLTIASTVCPDYSYETCEGVNRYTFKSLGGGIGLTAKRILETLPSLVDFFNFHHVSVTIKIALADTEVLDKKNMKRLGITPFEFRARLEESREAIKKAAGDLPVEVGMLSDFCGGLSNWQTTLTNYRELLNEDSFGGLCLQAQQLEDILKVRRSLYERWFGKQDDKAYFQQLKDQGAEYISAGEIIGSSQENCLIMGVDSPAMLPFYTASPKVQGIPVVYRTPHYE